MSVLYLLITESITDAKIEIVLIVQNIFKLIYIFTMKKK